jgi:type I restriction enzyme S subunit
MEVKHGYKQTEVGVIPEDWDVATFGGLFDVTAGGDLDPKRSASDQDETHCYPIYSNALTNLGLYGYCTYADHQARSITITARGTLGSANFRDHPYTAIGRVLVLQPKNEIAGSFFAEVINHRVKFAIESTGVPQLTAPQISTYRLPVPPLPEQRAIAEALSDMDALLRGLDRLIAKKRDLKQAAMQQLLTGQQRLPGFHSEWEVKRLTQICWFQEGPGVRNTQFTHSGVKLLNGTNIFMGEINLETTERFISENEAFGPYAHFLAQSGDIVIACSGVSIDRFHEKVAFVRQVHLPLCMNTSTMRFKPFVECLQSAFLFQVLMSDVFKKQIGSQATGSAQLNFGPSHVGKVEIPLPELAEQSAIAEVLSDMDAEIAALEQRLDKTRALKQGMMQELLTGRIRLI